MEEDNRAKPGKLPDKGKLSSPLSPRDTIIMYQAEIFEGLGIQNIPMPEFHELATMIGNNFGITVGEGKRTLVTGRVHPMLEKYNFKSYRALVDSIKNDQSGQLLSELANRISTNHTAFFREDAHFTTMRESVLPEIIARKKREGTNDIRIWCAACATGEEAYTILFSLLRFFGPEYRKWQSGLLATDISADALDKAKRGRYDRQRLAPVPPDMVQAYFDRVDKDVFEVKPELRQEITFRRLNLNNDVYPFKHPFDIIFCRNVMIYFSRAIRMRLLVKLREWLVPGGILFVGHSESLVGNHKGFDYLGPAQYARSE